MKGSANCHFISIVAVFMTMLMVVIFTHSVFAHVSSYTPIGYTRIVVNAMYIVTTGKISSVNKLFKIVLPVIGMLVFNTIGLTAHASMQSSHAGMEGMGHSSRMLSCANLCFSVPTSKNEDVDFFEENEEKDKYLEPDYASLVTPVSYLAKHKDEALLATKFDPPPGQPGYIRLSVFRA